MSFGPAVFLGMFCFIFLCCIYVIDGEMEAVPLSREKRQHAQMNLTITTIESEPFLSVVKVDGEDVFRGYIADLIEDICGQLQVNCQLRLVKDGNFGSMHDNGTWNGMIGELIRGEADVAAGPITITAQREQVVDFTKPFMQSGLTIVGRRPNMAGGPPGWRRLLEPFRDEVWLTIAASYVVVSLVSFLLNRFLPAAQDTRGEDRLHMSRAGQLVPSLLDSFWWTYRSLLWQGGDCLRSPTSIAMRILSGSWFIFSLLTALVYIVTLNSFYPGYWTSQGPLILPVDNAEDLSRQTEILYGATEGGAATHFFRTSSIPAYERMWSFMSTRNTLVPTVKEGLEKVRDDRIPYYLITDSPIVDYHVQQAPCDLIQIGGLLSSVGFGLALPHDAPNQLRDRLNLKILQLQEDEILQMLYNKWWYDRGECPAPAKKKSGEQPGATCERLVSAVALDLHMFSAPLVALAVGLVLTMLVALAEALYGKKLIVGSDMEDEQQLGETGPSDES